MAKITLNDIVKTYDTTLINSNFTAIENEFQNKVLYRNNPNGEPNGMLTNLDMNSRRILNLPAPSSPSEPARLQDVQGLSEITDLVEQAEAAAAAALVSENNAAASSASAGMSAANANISAISASTSASIASDAASDAASSAADAANYAAALVATSTSSVVLGSGPKVFTTQADKQFNNGQWVVAAEVGNPANYLSGPVTSYTGTTLNITAVTTGGSGTIANWDISVSGVQGVIGATGATGATGPQGPSVETLDEGVSLSSSTSSINFTGAGVTASNVGNAITVNIPGGAGSGTVTDVSVVNANGFNGSVATSSTTPAITLQTTISGVLKGASNALVAATAGTDYTAGTSALGTGILKSTTGTGAITVAVAGDFPTLNQNTTGTASNVTGTVAVLNGGTGQTTLTANGVVVGNGSAAVQTTTAGTVGQALISGGSGAPPAFGTLGVSGGGTGATTLTANGVLVGNGTGAITATSVGTAGQVLTSNGAGLAPTFQAAGGGSSKIDLLATVTPTAAANIDIFNVITSSYDSVFIIGQNIAPGSSPSSINMRVVTGTSTVDSSATAYKQGSFTASSTTNASSIIVAANVGDAGSNGSSTFRVDIDAIGTAQRRRIQSTSMDVTASSNFVVSSSLGGHDGSSAITGIRFFLGAGGNFSAQGKILVYGIRNT